MLNCEKICLLTIAGKEYNLEELKDKIILKPKLIKMELDKKLAFIEKNMISSYRDAGDFHEGLARVQNEEGLCGYINKEGEEVIPCKYQGVTNFCDGIAVVLENDSFKIIKKMDEKKREELRNKIIDLTNKLCDLCDNYVFDIANQSILPIENIKKGIKITTEDGRVFIDFNTSVEEFEKIKVNKIIGF